MRDTTFQKVDINYITWTLPERYEELEFLGTGTFGSVVRAVDRKTGRKVAIKKLAMAVHNSYRAEHTLREIRIVRCMKHENIIDLLDLLTPDAGPQSLDDIYLVSSLLEADLFRILQTQKLQEDHIRFIIYQLLRGLKYIHSAGIIHRDLKPNNIGMNEDCSLRILDFGMARPQDKKMSGYVSMRWYRAPEIMYNWTSYDQTADIWSVGCILAELLTGKVLFPGREQIEQFWKISNLLGTPGMGLVDRMSTSSARAYIRSFPEMPPRDFETEFPDASPQARDLLTLMLVWDPEDRVTAARALNHSYFEMYHDPFDEPDCKSIEFPYTAVSHLTVPEWKQLVWREIQEFQKDAPIDKCPRFYSGLSLQEKRIRNEENKENFAEDRYWFRRASRLRHTMGFYTGPVTRSVSTETVCSEPIIAQPCTSCDSGCYEEEQDREECRTTVRPNPEEHHRSSSNHETNRFHARSRAEQLRYERLNPTFRSNARRLYTFAYPLNRGDSGFFEKGTQASPATNRNLTDSPKMPCSCLQGMLTRMGVGQ